MGSWRFTRVGAACVALTTIVVACSSSGISPPISDASDESRSSCVPGQQLNCGCVGGAQGVRICSSDGSAYGQCACGDAATNEAGSDSAIDQVSQDAQSDVGQDSGPLTGAFQWDLDFGGAGATVQPLAVAVDASGNVVVAGDVVGSANFGTGPLDAGSSYYQSFVAKFTAAGAVLWSREFVDSGTDAANEGATIVGMAVDPAGDILISGGFYGSVDFGEGPITSAGGQDIFLAKLDPNGNGIWSERFGDAADQSGGPLAVDASSNVAMSGLFMGTVNFGGSTLSDGTTSTADSFLAKFDSSGAHVWSRNFPNTGVSSVMQVVTDASGDVFVAGWFELSLDFGAGPVITPNADAGGTADAGFFAKYSSTGAYAWARTFGGAATAWDHAKGLGLDSSGELFAVGDFQGTLDLGAGPMTSNAAGFSDIFLAKLDGTGAATWSQHFGGSGSMTGSSGALAVDHAGNLTLTGGFWGTVDFGGGPMTGSGGGSPILYVAKFTPSGAYAWSKGGTTASTSFSNGDGVTTDTAGNVLLTGHFFNGGTLALGGPPLSPQGIVDGFLAKFSP